MRQMVAIALVLFLAFPAAWAGPPLDTGVADAEAWRSLNMADEAARFLQSLPEGERNWAGPSQGEQSEAEMPEEAARLRLRILQLSSGSEVVLLLRNGQRVKGELSQAGKEEFSVRVPAGPGDSKDRPMMPKSFRYVDVQAAKLPTPRGWRRPDEAREFKSGTGVELLLLSGDKVRGRLNRISDGLLALEVEKGKPSDYRFDEVASIRSTGMRTSTKVIIGVGVAVGALILISLAALYYSGG